MPENENVNQEGLTWPAILLLLPKWLFAVAAFGFVGLMAIGLFVLEEPRKLGVLGEFGPREDKTSLELSFPEIVQSYLDRKWLNVTNERALGVDFTNLENYPIEIAVTVTGLSDRGDAGNPCDLQFRVDGEFVVHARDNSRNWARHCISVVTVPSKSKYNVASVGSGHNSGRLLHWAELR